MMKITVRWSAFIALALFAACQFDNADGDVQGGRNVVKVNGGSSGPRRIRIVPDDFRIEHCGRTADGRQVFVTGVFVARGDIAPGCEYVATFEWSADGTFKDATITDLGPRASLSDPSMTLR